MKTRALKRDDGADQSGDGDEAKASFEFVQKVHRCEHGRVSAALLQLGVAAR